MNQPQPIDTEKLLSLLIELNKRPKGKREFDLAMAILSELGRHKGVLGAALLYAAMPNNQALLEKFEAEVARACEKDPEMLARIAKKVEDYFAAEDEGRGVDK